MNIWFLRHGERYDHKNPDSWSSINGGRPYDSPLTQVGITNSYRTGVHLADKRERIDIIFTSPFLRCLQTTDAFLDGYLSKGMERPKIIVENGFAEVLLQNSPFPIDSQMIENKKVFQYTHNIQWDSHYNPEIKKMNEDMVDSYIRCNKTLKHIVAAFSNKNILICTHADNVKFGIATLIPNIEEIFIRKKKDELIFFDDNYALLEKTLPTNYYNTLAKVQRHRVYKDWHLTEHPSIFHIL